MATHPLSESAWPVDCVDARMYVNEHTIPTVGLNCRQFLLKQDNTFLVKSEAPSTLTS